MKNIRLAELDKYKNNPRYEHVEGNIFRDTKRKDGYVFAMAYELEEGESSQYPLEDILDLFRLHVSDFVDENNFHNTQAATIELGGKLENIKEAISSIIGKRVFNGEYPGEDGKMYIRPDIS